MATSPWIGCCVLRWKLMQPSAYRRRQLFNKHCRVVRGFCLSGRVDVQVIYCFKKDLVGENSLKKYAIQLKLWKNHTFYEVFFSMCVNRGFYVLIDKVLGMTVLVR